MSGAIPSHSVEGRIRSHAEAMDWSRAMHEEDEVRRWLESVAIIGIWDLILGERGRICSVLTYDLRFKGFSLLC